MVTENEVGRERSQAKAAVLKKKKIKTYKLFKENERLDFHSAVPFSDIRQL